MIRYLPIVLYIGFVVFCLIDCIQTPEAEMRNLPKIVWVLLIVVTEVLGAVAWLVAGRPQTRAAAAQGPTTRSAGFPSGGAPRSSMAPDDDPDFLRALKSSNDEHERMLKQWEDDLKRRENDMRDGPDDPTPPPHA